MKITKEIETKIDAEKFLFFIETVLSEIYRSNKRFGVNKNRKPAEASFLLWRVKKD